MLFDTHAHYDDERFDSDRDELLRSMPAQNVGLILNPAVDLASSRKAIGYAQKYPHMYAAVGIHPEDINEKWENDLSVIFELAQNEPKVRAVGEIGLDYYWDQESHDVQKKWFVRQLELAEKLGKPVNIHSRDAAADTMEIMREYGKRLRGIIHCYSYSPEMAAEYVKMGYSIGIGGVVTFKNGRKLKETVQEVPIESLVLETDCPYLSPEPNRGKRNSSLNLKYVAATIAELKGITPEEVIQITSENAERIYGI